MRQPSVRHQLRAATAQWHERVDALFSQFNLADHDDYARFLQAQASAHLPIEAALDAGGIEALFPEWPARRRGDALRRDLAALGVEVPMMAPVAGFEGPAAQLGALYVLEGSRLGGALLRRTVGAGLPTNFLGGGDPGAWRRLLDILETGVENDAGIVAATSAASQVFMLFEAGGRHLLKVA